MQENSVELVPEQIPLDIIFEDEDLFVINKPAGLVVHPAPGHASGTLVNALLYHYPAFSGVHAPERCGLVHRLDKGTSGVMVVAKTRAAQQDLMAQFKAHTVMKRYWALVYGHLQLREGVFESALGRHPVNRKKFAVRAVGGKPARTEYKVLAELEVFSALELCPQTGRTHQIRVHLSEAKHPIVGDPLYGGRRDLRRSLTQELRDAIRSLERPALHAEALGFKHPSTGKNLLFKAGLEEDLKELLKILS